MITSKPHYPEGDPRGFKFRLAQVEVEGGVRLFRVAMPRVPHRGFFNRLLLYTWFASFASILSVALARGNVVWASSQRIFSTYASLPAKLIWGTRLVSDVTDVWPEALVNTGYASERSTVFKLGRVLANVAYRVSDRITTMTPGMASLLHERYSVPREKIFVVPYVGKRFSGTRQGNGKFTVLYFGNLGRGYDFDIVFDVAKRLEHQGIIFTIRGDGELLSGMRAKLRERGLTNMRLLGETMNETQLSNLVESTDAFFLPLSKWQFQDASFPGKLIEYLHAGKPIICIGEGAAPGFVRKYDVGLAMSDPNPDAIADYLIRLKDDPALVDRLGENASRLAKAEFSEQRLDDSLARALFGYS